MEMLFVSGCGHSGTSLITAMLGAHSEIHALPTETHAFFRLDAEAIPAFFDQHIAEAAKQGAARYLCEKSPSHALFIDRIHRHYPEAPIVMAVRDPRDVGLSLMRRGKTLDEAIEAWLRSNSAIRAARGIIHFRYEDLVEGPVATLRGICDAIGLEFEPAMLRYHEDERDWFHAEGRYETDGSNIRKHRILRNWQIHQPLMDRRDRWREHLSPEQVARIEESCAELMRHFGYAASEGPA